MLLLGYNSQRKYIVIEIEDVSDRQYVAWYLDRWTTAYYEIKECMENLARLKDCLSEEEKVTMTETFTVGLSGLVSDFDIDK